MSPIAPAGFRRRAIPGLALALLLLAMSAPARTMAPPSFPGSIVTMGSSVIFAQPDGSLTELDASSGAVLHRTQRLGIRRLVADSGGLLVCDGSSSVTVIDAATSTVVWAAPGWATLLVDGMVVVRNGTTDCRDLATGRLLWSAPRNAMHMVARDGRLAMRMMDDPDVVLLELATGRELFARAHGGADGSHRVFLASDRLISVGYHSMRGPSGGVVPGDVIVWDFDGREIAHDPVGTVVPTGSGTYRYEDVVLGQDGHAHPLNSAPRAVADAFDTFFGDLTTVTLAFGSLEVSPTLCMGTYGGRPQSLIVMTLAGEESWSILAPDPHRGDWAVTRTGNRLLLGRPNGEVEALDTRDRRSVWVYKPPRAPYDPIRWFEFRPSAFHAQYLIPDMEAARLDWERGRARPGHCVPLHPAAGDVCDAAPAMYGGGDGTPRIIPDPQPTLVFRELRMLHVMAWTWLLAPPGAMLLLLALSRLRSRDPRWIILPVAALLTPTLLVARSVAPWSAPLLVAAIAVVLLGAGLAALAVALCVRRRHYAWALAGIAVAVSSWFAMGWLHHYWF